MFRNSSKRRLAFSGVLLFVALTILLRADIPTCQSIQMYFWALGSNAWLYFIIFYAISIMLFVPWSVFAILGGILFGPALGGLYVMLGVLLGVTLPFLIARLSGRDLIERKLRKRPWFIKFENLLESSGFSLIVALRLAQVIPYSWLNYACGVVSIRPHHYILGSLCGMLMGAITYVYLGHSLGCAYLDDERDLSAKAKQYIAIIVAFRISLSLTALAVIYRKMRMSTGIVRKNSYN